MLKYASDRLEDARDFSQDGEIRLLELLDGVPVLLEAGRLLCVHPIGHLSSEARLEPRDLRQGDYLTSSARWQALLSGP